VLSLQNLLVRNTGMRLSAKRLHELTQADLQGMLPEADQMLAGISSLAVLAWLRQQIKPLEPAIRKRLQPSPAYEPLLTVEGRGTILAQTILLETGQISRLPPVGNSASYCRGVKRIKSSHGKRKGQGNVKNGNPYLEWAYREAAQFAIRFSPRGQRFYQRQQANSHLMVARKAVAHKLARACYYIMRALVPFDGEQAFG
jgi:transposase